MEGTLGIFVLSHRYFCRHLSRYRCGQRIGGQDQDDHIDIVGRPIISVAFISYDRRQRRPVEQSYNAHNDRSSRKDSSLYRYAAACGFYIVISGFCIPLVFHLFFHLNNHAARRSGHKPLECKK